MQHVRVKPDDIDEQNRRYEQQPLSQPLFLNSVPKSGSHLLRNIIRMFVPVAQQYQRDFIQHSTLKDHLDAFAPRSNLLSWGHLFFSDAAAIELAGVRKILLVRDPYTWVLAKVRFILSNEFTGKLDYLKKEEISVDQLINLAIFGIVNKDPDMGTIFTHNAVAWLGTDIYLVRYEELLSMVKAIESDDADHYFSSLFEAAGIVRPADWRERVRLGSDRKRSGTARENLSGSARHVPEELKAVQREVINYAAPGLRAILGYE